MAKVSIVIPAKNEQENIEPLVFEIANALKGTREFEIIYVDDGSTDNTFAEITRLTAQVPELKAIKHQQSVGQSTAIFTGVNNAQGTFIATLDADGQNDPADIPALLALADVQASGSHFCIAGYRKKRSGDTKWKQLQSRIANKVRAWLLGDNTPDTGCGLKVYPKHTFKALPYFDHMHRFMPALIKRLGGNIVIEEVNHRERMAGDSNYTMFNRLWVGIVDILGVAWLQRRHKLATVIETTNMTK